ncbi:MAG: major outer membrane protein [Wolinella sp.]
MKLAKISLAAAVAICGLSTVSFAQPLEEAIKGVDVSGFLRYRYTDDRAKNQYFKNKGTKSEPANDTNARHQFRINADLKTPVVNNVAFNVGIVYHNWAHTANEGSTVGSGFGAGEDKEFGVSTYYATILPDSTHTVVKIGKMRLDTPVTDSLDDRGTGIVAVNTDLPYWTFAGVALDTWALDDVDLPGTTSATEGLYALAAIAHYENISAQAWVFHVNQAINNLVFTELAYNSKYFDLKGQFALSELDNGEDALFRGNESKKHSLYTLEAGVKYNPFSAKIGYIGSGKDGYKVSFDNQGVFSMGGRLWNDSSLTGVNYSAISSAPTSGETRELEVFYAGVAVDLGDRLNIGIDYVKGEDEIRQGVNKHTVKFQEITPIVSYRYSKNLKLSGWYAMLEVEDESKKAKADYADAEQNQLRLQALYSF